MKRYGRKCTVISYDGNKKIQVSAFINPLLYNGRTHIGGLCLPDGYYDEGHYIYIGSPRVRLDNLPNNSAVLCDGLKYIIKRAEQYFVGKEAIYTWAVLQAVERGGDNA